MKAAIVAIAGPELTADEAALIAFHRPAGVILFGRNIAGAASLGRLVASLRVVLPPDAVLMVDQEGGRVARLRPPDWLAHPAAGAIGESYDEDPAGSARLSWLTGALIGLECARAGFDVVCAPVLDVLAPGATTAIGDRSFGSRAGQVAALAQSFAEGLLTAGIQPVGKHAPGHGRAQVDSHVGLPRLPSHEAMGPEIAVFAACSALPWMMTAHVVHEGFDAELPATLSPVVIGDVIRGLIGFDGLLVSDDLAMGALSGPPGELARTAIEAGCDLALHCSGLLDETRAVLEAVPEVTGACLIRFEQARALAARYLLPLDRDALLAEQAGLLDDDPCSSNSCSSLLPPSQ